MNGDIRKFRFWCQKILPLVYDNSLSYYEVLCKIVSYLNKVIEDINSIPDYIDDVIAEHLTDEHLEEILRNFILSLESAISSHNEKSNTNSSSDYNIGQMLWWHDELYRVIRTIDAGDTLIIDSNIEKVNFEDLFNTFIENIKHDISSNDEYNNTNASKDYEIGDWLWINDVLYIVAKDIAQGHTFIYSGDNTNVKQISIEEQHEVIYYPNDKKLSIHGKISAYSEIVTAGDYHVYKPTIEAIEIRKVE